MKLASACFAPPPNISASVSDLLLSSYFLDTKLLPLDFDTSTEGRRLAVTGEIIEVVVAAVKQKEEGKIGWNSGDGCLQWRESAYSGRSTPASGRTKVRGLDYLFVVYFLSEAFNCDCILRSCKWSEVASGLAPKIAWSYIAYLCF